MVRVVVYQAGQSAAVGLRATDPEGLRAMMGDPEFARDLLAAVGFHEAFAYAMIGDGETVASLLAQGANVNSASKFGKTALMMAVEGVSAGEHLALTAEGRRHAVMFQHAEPDRNDAAWAGVPPIYWRHPRVQARGGATVATSPSGCSRGSTGWPSASCAIPPICRRSAS